MNKELIILNQESIKNRIYTIHELQAMLDEDLAEFYQVQTKVLNQAVKRNIERFPKEFMFQINKEEYRNLVSQVVIPSNNDLRSQIVTLKNKGGIHRKYLPYVFTEQGVANLSMIKIKELNHE